MSNETIKSFVLKRFEFLSLSTKLQESGTVRIKNLFNTVSNTEFKKVEKFYCDDVVIDKMGLVEFPLLSVFWSL